MPVFSPAAADDDAAGDDVEPAAVVELDEEQEVSRIDTTTRGTASPAVCLSFI